MLSSVSSSSMMNLLWIMVARWIEGAKHKGYIIILHPGSVVNSGVYRNCSRCSGEREHRALARTPEGGTSRAPRSARSPTWEHVPYTTLPCGSSPMFCHCVPIGDGLLLDNCTLPLRLSSAILVSETNVLAYNHTGSRFSDATPLS